MAVGTASLAAAGPITKGNVMSTISQVTSFASTYGIVFGAVSTYQVGEKAYVSSPPPCYDASICI